MNGRLKSTVYQCSEAHAKVDEATEYRVAPSLRTVGSESAHVLKWVL